MRKYSKGMPCWFELGTTDQAGAKDFYGGLLGWSPIDNPMGPGLVYTMFKLDGEDAGAVYTLEPAMVAAGVPPNWMVYFATPDVDESAAKVTELGGTVAQPPFDVMKHGRMAVCKDPGGAMFALWQAKEHPGVGVMGKDNSVCWSELATRDAEKVTAFYQALLGWQTKSGIPVYTEFSVDGRPYGGVMAMDEKWEGIPSHWGIYFQVADCDAAAAKAKDLGATLRHGPFSAPGVGRMAILADPQGAGFSLITLQRG